jgi:hypothetical protein
VVGQKTIDPGAKRFDDRLQARRESGLIGGGKRCLEVSEQRIFAILGLGIARAVGGCGRSAGKDVRSSEVIAEDFEGFGRGSRQGRNQA